MKHKQDLVVQWWHNSRDYQAGIMLLAQFSKNKTLIHTLSRKHEQFGRRKLEYELPKAVRLDFRNMPEESAISNLSPKNPLLDAIINNPITKVFSGDDSEDSTEEKPGEYPKVIRKLKYEYSELYKKRGVAHKEMGKVGSTNTPENNEARKKLLEDIKTISARMEFVYDHIDRFEKKNILPAEDILFPDKKTVKTIITLPVLKLRRANLLNANYKDKNRLLFQTSKKQETENIMPDGPKRDKIELRMKKRTIEIEAIESQILSLENAGDSK